MNESIDLQREDWNEVIKAMLAASHKLSSEELSDKLRALAAIIAVKLWDGRIPKTDLSE